MTEITIKIEAPELSAAILQLAEAMKPNASAVREIHVQKPAAPASALSAPAPAQPAPVCTPATNPVPIVPTTPIPVTMGSPAAQPSASVRPTVPTAPVPSSAPAQAVQAVAAAPTSAPQYTFDMLFNATAQLMNQNKGAQLQQLLTKYSIQRLPDLPRGQYGAFATDLRTLGVRI